MRLSADKDTRVWRVVRPSPFQSDNETTGIALEDEQGAMQCETIYEWDGTLLAGSKSNAAHFDGSIWRREFGMVDPDGWRSSAFWNGKRRYV